MNFQTRNWASVVWRTFWSDCEQRGSFERAPGNGLPRTMSGGVVCRPVSTLKADILNITYMIATLKITMSKWQHC